MYPRSVRDSDRRRIVHVSSMFAVTSPRFVQRNFVLPYGIEHRRDDAAWHVVWVAQRRLYGFTRKALESQPYPIISLQNRTRMSRGPYVIFGIMDIRRLTEIESLQGRSTLNSNHLWSSLMAMDVGQFAKLTHSIGAQVPSRVLRLSWEPDSVALDLFQLSSSLESRWLSIRDYFTRFPSRGVSRDDVETSPTSNNRYPLCAFLESLHPI